jgi:hypothetical protein
MLWRSLFDGKPVEFGGDLFGVDAACLSALHAR